MFCKSFPVLQCAHTKKEKDNKESKLERNKRINDLVLKGGAGVGSSRLSPKRLNRRLTDVLVQSAPHRTVTELRG